MATLDVTLGADIGKRVDPTAIIVAEREMRRGISHFVIRSIERVELGTTYPRVADRITEVVHGIKHHAFSVKRDEDRDLRLSVYVDATGVGTPVVDLLTERGVKATPCFFNGSEQRAEREDGSITIGKTWFVGRLQVLLQSSRIHLPNTAEAKALTDELLNYEIRVNDKANAQFGAFKTGTHDDLVTALGLAVGIESTPSIATDQSAFAPVEGRSRRPMSRQTRRAAWER